MESLVAISSSSEDYAFALLLKLFLIEHLRPNDVYLYAPRRFGRAELRQELEGIYLGAAVMVAIRSPVSSRVLDFETALIGQRNAKTPPMPSVLILLGGEVELPGVVAEDASQWRVTEPDPFRLALAIADNARELAALARSTQKSASPSGTMPQAKRHPSEPVAVSRHLSGALNYFDPYLAHSESDIQQSLRGAATLLGLNQQEHRAGNVVVSLKLLTQILRTANDAISLEPEAVAPSARNVRCFLRRTLSCLKDDDLEREAEINDAPAASIVRDHCLLVRLWNYLSYHGIDVTAYADCFSMFAQFSREEPLKLDAVEFRQLLQSCLHAVNHFEEELTKKFFPSKPIDLRRSATVKDLAAVTNDVFERVKSSRN